MALVLVVIGMLMVITGARGTYAQFGSQVASDFTGPQPFTWWIAAIAGVGALGYIDALRVFSRLFMALIIISMVLSNQGFFAKLTDALQKGPEAPKAPPKTVAPSVGAAPSKSTDAITKMPGTPAEDGFLSGFFKLFGAPSPLPGY